MTTTSIPIIYRRPADRLAVRIGRALVRWADARAARAAVPHERRAIQVERELALVERERLSTRLHELRG